MGNFSQPFLQQDLIGNVNYPQQGRTRGFVFGRRTSIDNTVVDLWDGPTDIYVFPTVAQQMLVKSSSENDTAAGTGMQQLMIHYLDSSYTPQITLLELSGTTGTLTTPTDILRINSVHATRVGSGGVAAGNVSITNTGATVTYGYIAAGFNTARQAIYTVPDGVTGYISHWQCSSGSASGNHFTPITLVANTHDNTLWPGVFLLQDEQGTQDNGFIIPFPIPIPIPARCDVKVQAISDGASANVTAYGAIMGWFENN